MDAKIRRVSQDALEQRKAEEARLAQEVAAELKKLKDSLYIQTQKIERDIEASKIARVRPQLFHVFHEKIESSAISIISLNDRSRSSALVASPVAMWSDTVSTDSASQRYFAASV